MGETVTWKYTCQVTYSVWEELTQVISTRVTGVSPPGTAYGHPNDQLLQDSADFSFTAFNTTGNTWDLTYLVASSLSPWSPTHTPTHTHTHMTTKKSGYLQISDFPSRMNGWKKAGGGGGLCKPGLPAACLTWGLFLDRQPPHWVWGVQTHVSGAVLTPSRLASSATLNTSLSSPPQVLAPSRAFQSITPAPLCLCSLAALSHTFLKGRKSPSDMEFLFGRVSLPFSPIPSSPGTWYSIKNSQEKKVFQTGGFHFSLIIQRLCNTSHACFNMGLSGKLLQRNSASWWDGSAS